MTSIDPFATISERIIVPVCDIKREYDSSDEMKTAGTTVDVVSDTPSEVLSSASQNEPQSGLASLELPQGCKESRND